MLPAAPSVSPGRPDASNPPGWCWRCRRRRCCRVAFSLCPGQRCPLGESQPSGVADLADTSDRGVRLHPSPREQQPHCPASLTVSVRGDQPSLRSESKRADEAPRPLSPVPPAGSAGGALQLHGDAVGAAGKVCQGGCSQ